MALFDKINEDIKLAMKAREKEKLEALRAVKAALLLAKTDGSYKEITGQDEVKLLQKLIKQRKDSAAIYKEQGRTDLYEKEAAEATFIEEYLPAQLSHEELTARVKAVIESIGAKGPQDMGKAMGAANKELAGKAEGKAIADVVKEILSLL
ncbi:MAG: GatB/YqeY domain-containing protein [Bacteroidales bacterium]|nr:GatB/YqeY domain-containing protein [Bacteroidales bacterium]